MSLRCAVAESKFDSATAQRKLMRNIRHVATPGECKKNHCSHDFAAHELSVSAYWTWWFGYLFNLSVHSLKQ